jgi:uncharacterized protein (DUF488 family)
LTLTYFTIGHSTRPALEFVDLLRLAEVELVVDVRSIPCSRAYPQYNQDQLKSTLAGFQIRYEHVAELGGRRSKQPGIDAQVNAFWTNQSFHNYADYAMTPAFRRGLARLRRLGRDRSCAIMCSEAVWWRCHRRIIADYLLSEGDRVFHILASENIKPAKKTPAAVSQTGHILSYPPS